MIKSAKSQNNQQNFISVVSPVYNEEGNLREMYQRLCKSLEATGMDWEWIAVDDHSADKTPEILAELAEKDSRVHYFRFSRNFGSHAAINCGLREAKGDCMLVMAADLQDPPEEAPRLIAEWQKGYDVVWACRARREGESLSVTLPSKVYCYMMNKMSSFSQKTDTVADFFLIDKKVATAVSKFNEKNASLLALITWLGFKQASIEYVKQARGAGESGWTLKKKLKLFIDTITSFTYLPIRMMSSFGSLTALCGFLYTAYLILWAMFSDAPFPGYASTMAAILVFGGIQMVMLGILGEYLWRALDESRNRPLYIIEDYSKNSDGVDIDES